jgi:hypothetical protein
MPEFDHLENVDEATQLLMEAHARLVQALEPSNDNGWSLAQPNPYRFVPSIITDSTSTPTE